MPMKRKNVDCLSCGTNQFFSDEIGLNKKLLGKNTKQYY
jgi:hypothetical protein